MSAQDQPPLEHWLHELVDDRVPPAEHDDALAAVAADPDAARRLAAYRDLNALMRRVYDPLLDRPVPPALERSARLPQRSRPLRSAAAALVLVAIGAGGGWFARDLAAPEPVTAAMAPIARFVASARDAHLVYEPEIRHPVEVGAAEREHLVTWLSKRLGSRLDAPDLRTEGFDLVGGRLLPGDGAPAAQFMYQSDTGRRVTLYMRAAVAGAGASALRYADFGGTGVVWWVDPPVAYALAGGIDHEQLEQLARIVYTRLNP